MASCIERACQLPPPVDPRPLTHKASRKQVKSSTNKRGRSWGRVLMLGLLIGPVVLLFAAAIWWFGRQAIASNELQQRIGELQAAGMPVDDATLQSFYARSTDPSLAEEWVAIVETTEEPSFMDPLWELLLRGWDGNVPPRGAPWAAETEVRDILDTHQPLLEKIDRIAEPTSAVRYPNKLGSGNTLVASSQGLRQVVKLLGLRHQVAMRDRDGNEAVQSLLGMLAVVRSAQQDPSLVSQVMRISWLAVALDELRQGLEIDLYNERTLRQIRRALERLDGTSAALRKTLIGERAVTLIALTNANRDSDGISGILNNRAIGGLAVIDLYERMLSTIGDDYRTDYPRFVRGQARFEDNLRQASLLRLLDVLETLNLSTAGSTGYTAQQFARSMNRKRLAEIAIGIRLYRHTRDSWPTSLDDLAEIGFAPKDLKPTGPKPFGYRVEHNDTAMAWGFSLPDEPDLSGIQQTPDDPPLAETFDESNWVYRLRDD